MNKPSLNRRRRARPSRKAKTSGSWLSWLSPPWRIAIIVSTLLGLGGIFTFLPRLDIAPGPGYASVNDPLTAPLSLSNNGYLPIYLDRVSSYVNDWKNTAGNYATGFSIEYLGRGTLERGETAEFIHDKFFGMTAKVIAADFVVTVRYYQWGWRWPLEKRIRFTAKRGENDRWEWYRPFMTDFDRKAKPLTRFLPQ
jgi:hypothetical protein